MLSRTELECEAACVEALDLENQTLKRELAQLQRSKEGVDAPSPRSEVTSETERLRAEVARLNKVSGWCVCVCVFVCVFTPSHSL